MGCTNISVIRTFCQTGRKSAYRELSTRKAFRPVWDAMEAVQQAADANVLTTSSKEFNSRLRGTIERLRKTADEAAPGKLLPCLLEWPSK